MTEFGLIDHIRTLCRQLPANGIEGIGDDCAVMPVGDGEALVMTSDLLVEGVHFLRHAASAEQIGRKALAVNLSDVASMGARPVATLLSVALPRDTMEGDWAERFMAGYTAMSGEYGVALIGGDTTASPHEVTINVTAIGRMPVECVKRRSAARAGDRILVGGPLGESAAGLRDILAGRLSTPLADIHRQPRPQVAEGIWLGGREEVHAMMDLSDGLASDLRHILRASGLCAEVEIGRIPAPQGIEAAVSGGEDYKLLLTADGDRAAALCADFERHFGAPLYDIGRIVEPSAAASDDPLRWLRDGQPFAADWQGFRHY